MAYDIKTHEIMAKALGIDALPLDEQELVLERSVVIIYQSVVTRAMEEMTDDAVDEFEKMLEKEPTAEEVLAFFRANIPGFDAMIEEETKLFMDRGMPASV